MIAREKSFSMPSRHAPALLLVVWVGLGVATGCSGLVPKSVPAAGAARVILVQPGSAVGEANAVGCGDRLLAVLVPIPAEENPLVSALRALLQRGDELASHNGLYNALSLSRLRVDSVETVGMGALRVHLVGELRIGGACDGPRIVAQLERTVMQYPDVRQVTILVNGVELSELLSTR